MPSDDLWSLPLSDLYSRLSSSENGLSSKRAKEALAEFGPNSVPDKDRREVLDILFSQLANPLQLILIFASVISAFLGEVLDTAMIFVIIIFSVVLGFFQEYKSEQVLKELKKLFAFHAVVFRDGEKIQVDSRTLVPGDVVFSGVGDIIPADLRVIETNGIIVDESILTGESREVEKSASPSKSSFVSPQETKNGLFMGTIVTHGYAKAIVVSTGTETVFGKTVSVFSSKIPESDFQIGIRQFGAMLMKMIAVIAVFVFFSNIFLGHMERNLLVDSALFALALAVGIAPEALPLIITVTLSSGSMKLAKKKVVTKKLAAIEDLGNMDVLCTDKTGTLTEEGLKAQSFVDADGKESAEAFLYSFLCNSAVGTVHVKGNSIDAAIRKRGLSEKIDSSGYSKLGFAPFDFERRRMSQVVEASGKRILIVKGAPESVFSACSSIKVGSKAVPFPSRGAELKKRLDSYSQDGFSVIAVAFKPFSPEKCSSKDESGLAFLGFVLLSSPPKRDVKHTIERLKSLNVKLKIITGDDPLVTARLCSDVGFSPSLGKIVLGSELEKMNPAELRETVEKHDVFSRVAPAQKLAIVEALRANGHVVGFLGDGINDAPALRSADVGISVDTASDVAKSASHMILLHRSLNVVCDGVEEGRKIFGNIMKYILNTISANLGNMATVVLSVFFLPFIPLLPSQILLNNLLSDMPLLSISGDNVDKEYVQRPHKWSNKMILRFMVFFGLISTLYDLLFIAIMYFVWGVDVAMFRTAWFLESVLSEMLILFSLRTHLPFFRSIPAKIIVAVTLLSMVVAFGAVYYAPVAEMFHFVPPDSSILLLMAVILAAYFATVEVGKRIFYTKLYPPN